jgi:kynureninase
MYTKEDKTKNNEAIKNEISKLGPKVSYEMVSEILPKLLAEKRLILNHLVYTPADPTTLEASGIGRYLVYDHPDKTNPFSIWVFAFAPRQKTSIHDHEYKGTVIVLEEPISEKFYQPTSEDSAQLIERTDRYRFHCNKDDLNGNFVHQLKRRKGLGMGISVTLHIYNMEAHLINQGSEIIDRRNLDQIYSKDKIFDKSRIPPYKEEFPDLSDQLYSL